MMISCPVLRVYLSDVGPSDAFAMAENSNDYETARNVPNMPYPYTIDNAMTFIEFARLRRLERLDFHMAVRLLDNTLVGMCAIANIDMLNSKAELGYWIGKNYRENGYANEAIRLMLHFGFRTMGLNRIYAKVLTSNENSAKLLDTLGFSREGTARGEVLHMGKFMDVITFSMLKGECKELVGAMVDGYE